MPVGKVCESCGAKFNVPPSKAESVRFCSRECKTAAGRLVLTCAACGDVFERVKSSQARSSADYCSLGCYRATAAGRLQVRAEPVQRHFKVCETCRKDFRVTKTRAETARFCSRACQSANPNWRMECSEKQQAEKHWRWSGGKYRMKCGYVREKRKTFEGEKALWEHRKVVLDAMLAQAPDHPFLVDVNGKKTLSQSIEVHHIDRDRKNNAPENLLAVTKQAHAQIHHSDRKPEPWECWPPNPAKW